MVGRPRIARIRQTSSVDLIVLTLPPKIYLFTPGGVSADEFQAFLTERSMLG